ncbi:MAG TPA: electron transfer flavoprotein subunit alpha/FixB family protein [Actinomycetales bacterium]|nr:electron transfer flavoprotein subunit alpha/FixB family protein [Actinomycetales bacterium]
MILVFVETDAGGVVEVSRETLTFSRGLAERAGGLPVHVVVIGDVPAGTTSQLAAQGVQRVHHAQDERLQAYSGAAWSAAVVDAARDGDARAVLAAGTPRGSEILAHTSVRLGVAMAANVVAIEAVSPLVVSRQVLGGSALEEMRLDDDVAVLTVAGHAVESAEVSDVTTPDVVTVAPNLRDGDLLTRVVRTDQGEPDQSGALASAHVVVGAGRGAGGRDGFEDLLELTDLLGGALGVSRVVTNLGWRPHHEQVGQTGSRIAPDLYIPCGISGAIQHWAGCSGAKTILAVNNDPEAPMVTKAHYAVIGDLHEVVPAINAEILRRRP